MVLCLRINNGLIVEGIVVNSSRYTIAPSYATIEKGNKEISVMRQAELLGISRAAIYYKPVKAWLKRKRTGR